MGNDNLTRMEVAEKFVSLHDEIFDKCNAFDFVETGMSYLLAILKGHGAEKEEVLRLVSHLWDRTEVKLSNSEEEERSSVEEIDKG